MPDFEALEKVLRAIEAGARSQAEIKSHTRLKNDAVGDCLAELWDQDIIRHKTGAWYLTEKAG